MSGLVRRSRYNYQHILPSKWYELGIGHGQDDTDIFTLLRQGWENPYREWYSWLLHNPGHHKAYNAGVQQGRYNRKKGNNHAD